MQGRRADETDPQVRALVAAALDDIDFFPDLSVVEHLELVAYAHGGNAEPVEEVLAELGLEPARDQLPVTLSSGQRRRLALASCFVRPRRVLILDEPEQRLDVRGRQWLADRLLPGTGGGHGRAVGLARPGADRRGGRRAHRDRQVTAAPATIADTPVGVPSARQVRTHLRKARSRHHDHSLGDVLGDAYVMVLFVGMYGWFAISASRDLLDSPTVGQAEPGVRWWLAVAALLAGAGLAWRGLRALGPLLVTPATQSWATSAPIDRRAWLAPRFVLLLLGSAAGTAALGSGGGGARWGQRTGRPGLGGGGRRGVGRGRAGAQRRRPEQPVGATLAERGRGGADGGGGRDHRSGGVRRSPRRRAAPADDDTDRRVVRRRGAPRGRGHDPRGTRAAPGRPGHPDHRRAVRQRRRHGHDPAGSEPARRPRGEPPLAPDRPGPQPPVPARPRLVGTAPGRRTPAAPAPERRADLGGADRGAVRCRARPARVGRGRAGGVRVPRRQPADRRSAVGQPLTRAAPGARWQRQPAARDPRGGAGCRRGPVVVADPAHRRPGARPGWRRRWRSVWWPPRSGPAPARRSTTAARRSTRRSGWSRST